VFIQKADMEKRRKQVRYINITEKREKKKNYDRFHTNA
jgi:hypothetical protein